MLNFIHALAMGVLIVALGGCCCGVSDWTSFEVRNVDEVATDSSMLGHPEISTITELALDAAKGYGFPQSVSGVPSDSTAFLFLRTWEGGSPMGVTLTGWVTETRSLMLVVEFWHNGPGWYDGSHGVYDDVRRNLLNALSAQYEGRLLVNERANTPEAPPRPPRGVWEF